MMKASERLALKDRMISLMREIYPFQRMINSPGLDKAFEAVSRVLPEITIHEYPSGMECEDWIVPNSWHVKEGYMHDSSGSIIASVEENYLFVAPYSEPIEGWFTKEEISNHLLTRPDRPEAFALEHRNAYDYKLKDWAITLPFNRWQQLPEGKYYIKIDIENKPGTMKVGEYYLEGKEKGILCIAAHIDELCNDDLSGCIVAIELIKALEKKQDRRFSYQLLLVPEMFGTLFYISNNREKIEKTMGMLFLETLGAGREWCLKKSLREEGWLEKALKNAMEDLHLPFKELNFFEGYSNDERVYGWPTINIPGISLQRFPFKEYHTSDDNPDLVNGDYLLEALDICLRFIQILECDYVPRYTNYLQPWLTRSGLYYDAQEDPENFEIFNNHILFNINGNNSILDLASRTGLSFFKVYDYLELFFEKKLIEKLPVVWD
ncbi:MAG: DUF4910 domain-containing protein [Deltaproteobacteria bacterium]|nr:DUF4910 domain-containing protein [Deltaproteobacteria bacterium]